MYLFNLGFSLFQKKGRKKLWQALELKTFTHNFQRLSTLYERGFREILGGLIPPSPQ